MYTQSIVCFGTSLLLIGGCVGDTSNSTDATSEAGTTDTSTADAATGTDSEVTGETQSSETEDPTTGGPTTEDPTTEDPTTEDPTTEDPTTEDPTTEEPTTEDPTTEDPTTEDPTDDPTEGQEVLPPTDSAELLIWLQNGEYEWWPSDSVHESNGPHFGQVQTFFNPALHDSFEADDPAHPAGAATVKRLLGGGNATGWSVAVKTQDDSDGGNGWYWYEYYEGNTFADGNGIGLCTNCHSGGKDYVLTPFPLL